MQDSDTSAEDLIDVGDVELFVKRVGSSALPPLLVVHGGPSWDHSYLLPATRLIDAWVSGRPMCSDFPMEDRLRFG